MADMHFDVAVIGGGPGGSTTGTLLKKYGPDLKVGLFEREKFPRDHIGESQLPGISGVLNEMGVWNKVEAANFPIKLGGTYRWGKSRELWDVEFYSMDQFKEEPRPAQYAGQRLATAFQVDRSIYDEILLDHAQESGCDVFEETRVLKVHHTGDHVDSLELEDGSRVTARYYVDASGHSGVLRRALDVPTEYPTSLQNIAVWEYWQNADWAVEIGVGATFIQVLSVGYGWFWFIPLGPTRTSIGLVIPVDYYKKSGKKPKELYDEALGSDEKLQALLTHAVSEGKTYTTNDWSFLSGRQTGENWFLVGEAGGFADPILSAGLTITHAGGRELAFTILELDREELNANWLKQQYANRQSQRVRNHMRFAEYWYSANEQMVDLKEYTKQIAEENGLDLTPQKAWEWIAQGGFVREDSTTGTGSFGVSIITKMGEFMGPAFSEAAFTGKNVFKLNLSGAERTKRALYQGGRVIQREAFERNGRILPLIGSFGYMINLLERETVGVRIADTILKHVGQLQGSEEQKRAHLFGVVQAWEAMILDGWVDTSFDVKLPISDLTLEYSGIGWNTYGSTTSK